jgi:hypothetical protein
MLANVTGVGISYHPFLHDAILATPDAFDFIELPLDLYIDPARAGLFDPSGERLRDLAAAKPCVWQGTALSLGSVEDTLDARRIERIGHLLARTGSTRYIDRIGFRRLAGRDLGLPQGLPYTATAARWIAARARAASAALGHDIALQHCRTAFPAANTHAAYFLAEIAALTGHGLAIEVADAAADDLAELPPGTIATLITDASSDAAWAGLARLAAQTAPATIIIRRSGGFYPLTAIFDAARRVAELLGPHRTLAPAAPADPPAPEAAELAALQTEQRSLIDYCLAPTGDSPGGGTTQALAARVQSWHTWRQRLVDTHKAQQIAQFLASDAVRPARTGA